MKFTNPLPRLSELIHKPCASINSVKRENETTR